MIRRASSRASRRRSRRLDRCGLGTIAQLRHAFLFGAMSTAKDRAVFFNPVADDVRATMRASRCQGLNCTFKAVKGVSAAVQCNLERLVVVIAASFACWHGCLANENGSGTAGNPCRQEPVPSFVWRDRQFDFGFCVKSFFSQPFIMARARNSASLRDPMTSLPAISTPAG